MMGVEPPGGIYTHIVGIDLVRTGPDEFLVLEDNARTPSGVSYMLENRETMLQMFPDLFSENNVRPVSGYTSGLRRSLCASAPPKCTGDPVLAVLTPGIHNSAYFEHAFLADEMSVELVEGHDLRVVDGRVAMRTTAGYKPIDVLYRRVDDDFLDPLTFNPDSMLGVPVPTWRCSEADSLAYVLDNLEELVVKEVHGSGGYGMLVGPAASKQEIADFSTKLREKPSNYIAQPTLALSTVPILTKAGLAPRHVDLRPFVRVSPNGIEITPGGLTRVALKEGSLVVNSSQGGGTKDTWVLGE